MVLKTDKPCWIMHRNRPVMVTVEKQLWLVKTITGEHTRILAESELFEDKEQLLASLKLNGSTG